MSPVFFSISGHSISSTDNLSSRCENPVRLKERYGVSNVLRAPFELNGVIQLHRDCESTCIIRRLGCVDHWTAGLLFCKFAMIAGQKVTGTRAANIGVYGYTHDYLSSMIWVVCVLFRTTSVHRSTPLILGSWLAREKSFKI